MVNLSWFAPFNSIAAGWRAFLLCGLVAYLLFEWATPLPARLDLAETPATNKKRGKNDECAF